MNNALLLLRANSLCGIEKIENPTNYCIEAVSNAKIQKVSSCEGRNLIHNDQDYSAKLAEENDGLRVMRQPNVFGKTIQTSD